MYTLSFSVRGINRSLAGFAWILISLACVSSGTEPAKVSTVVQNGDGVIPFCEVDLGPLVANKPIVVSMEIFNATDGVILFDEIGKTCSCQELRPTSGMIEVDKTLGFTFEFSPPGNSKQIRSTVGLQLLHKKITMLDIKIKYGLAAYAGFANTSILMTIAPNETEFIHRAGIFKSDDISFYDLEVTVEGLGDSANAKLSQDSEGPCVTLEWKQQVTELPQYGSLVLLNLVSGVTTHCPIIIEQHQSFRVAPKILRFRRVSDADDIEQELKESVRYVAVLYLLEHKDQGEHTGQSIVSVTLSDRPVEFSKVLDSAVAAYRVVLSKSDVDACNRAGNSPACLIATVVSDDKPVDIKVPFSLFEF